MSLDMDYDLEQQDQCWVVKARQDLGPLIQQCAVERSLGLHDQARGMVKIGELPQILIWDFQQKTGLNPLEKGQEDILLKLLQEYTAFQTSNKYKG